MKDLLNSIKARLESEIGYLTAIHIVNDPDDVPDGAAPPYVTLADRGLVPEYDKYSRKETLTIRATAYQEILREEASLMGSGSAKGTLEIVSDIRAAFHNYLPEAYHDTRCVSELPSEVVVSENQFAARKALEQIWVRQIDGE